MIKLLEEYYFDFCLLEFTVNSIKSNDTLRLHFDKLLCEKFDFD